MRLLISGSWVRAPRWALDNFFMSFFRLIFRLNLLTKLLLEFLAVRIFRIFVCYNFNFSIRLNCLLAFFSDKVSHRKTTTGKKSRVQRERRGVGVGVIGEICTRVGRKIFARKRVEFVVELLLVQSNLHVRPPLLRDHPS